MKKAAVRNIDRDLFMKLTGQRFHSMVQRFSEKKNIRGRVIRAAMTVPFTLPEFRDWVLKLFNMAFGSTIRCTHCRAWIDIERTRFDHNTPVSRGGSLGFENLCPTCEMCNDIKGGLTGGEFAYLLECLTKMPAAAEQDVKKRLQKAHKLAAGARWAQKKAAKVGAYAGAVHSKTVTEEADDGF